MGNKIKEPVPARPFQQVIEDMIHRFTLDGGDSPTKRVVAAFGWDKGKAHDAGERRLYRYRYLRSETQRGTVAGVRGPRVVTELEAVERATVEDALFHADIPFEDVYPPEMYPALYEDIPLEAEEWCPSCQDHCTPIHSVCPWCEWRFGAPQLSLEDAA